MHSDNQRQDILKMTPCYRMGNVGWTINFPSSSSY